MKKRWQWLYERLAAWGAGSLRQAARWVGLVRWRLVLGSVAGVALAALVYFALANHGPARGWPGRAWTTKNGHQQLAQRIQAIFPPHERLDYNIMSNYIDFTDSLDEVTAQLQRQDSSRHSLTLRELLHFRQQVVSQNAQLYEGLNLLHSWRLSQALDSLRSGEECASLASSLASNQYHLLDIIDSTQQDLALVQLRYLQQGQVSNPLAVRQLELARLQLRDSRAQPDSSLHSYANTLPLSHLSARATPQPTVLAQQKLALASTLELQQGEAATKRDAVVRQLLDSCQREVHLLRWLDSCRAQLSWKWTPADSVPAKSQLNSTDLPDTFTGNTSLFSRDYLPMVWLALFLLVVPLPFVLFFLGRRQHKRGLQAAPVPPDQELESPVLQLLLRAYASHIRTLLRTPRQIKRFAGKVRLQHHLLEVLARQPQAATPFSFGPAEQVQAFVLLLLIEEAAQSSYALNQSEAEFAQSLREAYRKACAEGQLHASIKKQFLFRREKVWLRLARANTNQQTLVTFKVALAENSSPDDATERLLKQLYWMNAGLLV